MKLSKLALSLTPSPIFALNARVEELQKKGIPVVNLCIGEPDFATPTPIQKAAYQAIKDGYTHYSLGAGIRELREAIALKLAQDNKLKYKSDEIVVTQGTKSALYLIFLAVLNRGDEVLIPAPCWSSYVEMVNVAGGKPVLLKLKPPFRLTEADLKRKISRKTKIILLNSPSNPTGVMVEQAELEKIADLVIERNLLLVSDEIYEKLTYGKPFISIASLKKDILRRTITVNGYSKAYAMTGWRIGYAAGPLAIISAVSGLQSQIASSAVTFVQKSGIDALTSDQADLFRMQKEFSIRRDYIVSEFSKMPKISFTPPDGAFYLFVAVKKMLGGKYKTSTDWCEALLVKQKIAVTPGEAFFYPGYFRLSFASSMENLKKAVEGINRFIINSEH